MAEEIYNTEDSYEVIVRKWFHSFAPKHLNVLILIAKSIYICVGPLHKKKHLWLYSIVVYSDSDTTSLSINTS